MKKIYLQLLLAVCTCCFCTATASAQVFVKQDASGSNDGSSWANAYTDLEVALDNSPSGEVWVAAGVYRPGGTAPDTFSVFAIKSDLALYGGFDGTEGSLAERDPAANVTILSGDINGDDIPTDFLTNKSDNTRHVVYVDSLLSSVTINGFTIRGGHTNEFSESEYYTRAGGGIYSLSPTIIFTCEFTGNSARSGGCILLGGEAHGSVVGNCNFSLNRATSQGAGIHAISIEDVTVENCTFTNNQTARGAIYPLTCNNVLIKDCLFEDNTNDGGFGGGMFSWSNTNITVQNCDFLGNTSGSAAGMYLDGRNLDNAHPNDNLLIKDCTFAGNNASGNGGAIYMYEANLTMENCGFDENDSGSGSHLFFSNPGGSVVVKDCGFTNATGSGWGGAATAYGLDCEYLFEDCIFEDNTVANLAGAVNCGFGAIVTFADCEFNDNTSLSSAGGAIALQNDSTTAIIMDCSFMDNTAANNGGAIFSGSNESSSIVVVDGCSFFTNSSETGFGGAISVNEFGDDDISALTVSNSVFGFNSAMDQGSAINMGDSETEITSCLFFSNFCLGAGRGTIALNVNDSNSVSVKMVNCTVADNSGTFSSGISAWAETENAIMNTDLLNCLFLGNGVANYAIEDGSPVLTSSGGNLSDDESMLDFLNEMTDIHETEAEFVDPDDFDYNLVDDSPGIDAGVAEGAPEFDIDGNPRINAPDIGAYENQNVVKVEEALLENNGMLVVSPNPVKISYANLSLENDWHGEIEIRLTDTQGRLVRTQVFEKMAGRAQFQFPLENVKTGVYQLSVSNSEEVVVERLVRLN